MVGDIVHICNRGVNKQTIFCGVNDYMRFVESLYKFNNKGDSLRSRSLFDNLPPQEKIVEILKWSLLPNHYHLLVYEKVEGGVTQFAKRIGNGYTKYFNIKNKRSGYLFQNKAKIIKVEDDAHFLYLPYYVELNPLDLFDTAWRDEGIHQKKRAEVFLSTYRWSSYQDYVGKKNFPMIINKDLFFDLFETNKAAYGKEMWKLLEATPVSTWHVDTGGI